MTQEQARRAAQREADRFGVEYGVRKSGPGEHEWEFSDASWYATVHKQNGWSLDDIELILPKGSDDTTWPEVQKKWDEYDPTPSGAEE